MNPKVKIAIGDQALKEDAQIIVTTIQWISNRLSSKSPIDLSKLQMVAYDEADEIFKQEIAHKFIATFIKKTEELEF